MIKRLSISLLLMGLAAFSLGAAAFAWFSTSETGQVSITSGSPNIAIDVQVDCEGNPVTIDDDPFNFNWHDIVPGDSTRDCFVVHNNGDGELDLFVQHSGFGGLLVDEIEFTYDLNANPTNVLCGPADADAAAFTTANGSKGCEIGTVAEGGSLAFEVRVLFPYADSDQNGLQNKALNMTSTLTGYTTP